MKDDRFYEIVAEEIERQSLVPGLWTRSYAEADGNEARAKAIYIRYRVAELAKAEKSTPAESTYQPATFPGPPNVQILAMPHGQSAKGAREVARALDEKDAAPLQRKYDQENEDQARSCPSVVPTLGARHTKTKAAKPHKNRNIRTWVSIALLAISFAAFAAAVGQSNVNKVQTLTEFFLKFVLGAAFLGFVVARKGYRLLFISIIITAGAIFFALLAFHRNETDRRFATSLRAFAKDARRHVENGDTQNLPSAPPTGNATDDALLRCIRDFSQVISTVMVKMNDDLSHLETDDNAFSESLSADKLRTNAQTETRKRLEAQTVIAKAHDDFSRQVDTFVQTAPARYASAEERNEFRSGLEGAVPAFSNQFKRLFDLLGKKAKAELDLYEFLSRQDFNAGKVSFHTPRDRQKYQELVAVAEDSRKNLETYREQVLARANESIKGLTN